MPKSEEKPALTVDLYPHQLKALEELDNGKILKGGTGSGKSRVAAAYYMKKEADTDVYVITTPKKRDSLDWDGEFAKFGVGRHLSGTVAGALVVDSWNNIGRYSDVRGAFFIFDEQRAIGAGEWAKQFIHIAKANRWIILSATPGDTWLDYIPVMVANGFYKNRTDFKQQHVVYNTYSKFPKVDRYIAVGKLVRLRNQILVEMPYARHTTRNTRILKVDYDKELMEKVTEKRWHVFEERPLKAVAELFSVSRRVANSNSSRIQTIKMLMEEHPKIIIFYNFNYELDLLRTLITSHVSSTSTTRQKIGEKSTSSTFEAPKPNLKSSISALAPLTNEPDFLLIGLSGPNGKSEVLPRQNKNFDSSTGQPCKSETHRSGDPLQSMIQQLSESFQTEENEECSQTKKSTKTEIGTQTPTETSTNESTTSERMSMNGFLFGSRLEDEKFKTQTTKLLEKSSKLSSDPSPPNSGSFLRNSASDTQLLEEVKWSGKPSKVFSSDANSNFTKIEHQNVPTEVEFLETIGTQQIQKMETASSTKKELDNTTNLIQNRKSDNGFQIAEWNGHKHEEIPDTDRWIYLVQYASGAEGWNCISTDAMVFYSLSYSYKMFQQAYGRIDRLNTPFKNLYYYVLKSDSWIDQAIWRALRTKKDFNENKFVNGHFATNQAY